ncbi:hypothetical protein C2G38_1000778 [Gigaspora rosea]|uniref:Protein kinase domain-containing protein n=1 Tax=Gigaspora rosea TaxID=44941 RepID=A0A397TTJ9_9GLOM|nr:hypothetical protein C2G38_1000778 [Gigaspora rosea]
MFIHEYANEGTLRQYLDQYFYMLNWNDKFNFAKQLVSAIKCLHENDIVHLNLNPKNIFVHEGNLKLNAFGAFQYRSKFLNKIKLMQYTDPQYLENHETYKLNKSSDIYSIGVLLWEISSGIVPFKSELSYGFNLLNAIIHGKREDAVPGTPTKYVKIYTECWRYGSNLRPTIQHVFKEINNINYNFEEIITESIKDKEYREKPISKLENSNQIDLLQHYIDLRYEMIKELEIISSITTTLNKTLVEDSSVNCSLFTLNIYENVLEKVPKRSSLFITNQLYDYDLQKFLFDLNHLFISQFNIQGISEITTSSIVQCLRNFIDDNNKCPFKILEQYYTHQLRICFTGIIGFFYEYGIGTSVDYCKAFDMYKKAAEEFYFTNNDSLNKSNYFFNTEDLLKENQIIGLISLGNLYIYGKGVLVNKQKAFQLFLKSVLRGSVLGKCYIGDCYHYGYGVIEDHSQSFDWYLKSAEEGNARAQNAVGYCYQFSDKIPKNDYLAFTWFSKSIDNGNYLGYRNLGYCYQFGIGTPVDEKQAFKYFKKSANGENSIGQNDLGYCYQNGRGTLKNESKAFSYYMKSAKNGNSLGQCNLGRCYSHGIGTSVDEKLASEWYKESVKKGRYKIGQHCSLHE